MKTLFKNDTENDEIDYTIRENALKVLGLSEKEAEDRLILDERYQDMCKAYSDRMLRVKKLKYEPFAKDIEKILNQVHQSYHTLTR